ncbi:MAG TPA: hypothetical protein VM368_04500 [Flavisolibacter sp.]|nr:hypothetical protein [Flavisolibacter sp.]
MKKPLFLLLMFCFSIAASAQKVFFVYIQSENQVPFYVKMSDKLYSSASSGFLILPNLPDSTYHFSLGFPNNPAEKNYSITINGSDKGLLIKQIENAPAIVDLQTNSIINPNIESTANVQFETKTDRFTKLLSKAADDPSLVNVVVKKAEPPKPIIEKEVVTAKEEISKPLETEVVQVREEVKEVSAINTEEQKTAEVKKETKPVILIKEEQKSEPLQVKVETTTEIVSKTNESEKVIVDTAKSIQLQVQNHQDNELAKAEKQEVIPEDIKNTEVKTEVPVEEFKRSKVRRRSSTSSSEGHTVVYYDNQKDRSDTIRILIPNSKITLKTTEEVAAVNNFEVIEEKKVTAVEPKKEEVVVTAKKTINSSCAEVASEKDFFKLRKNMAGKMTDELMVDEAKKAFKKQCFTSEQLKNLSSLFLTSAGKYLFFDAAFLYVTDKNNFNSLQSEIKDDYYIKRFKALVGE